MWGQPRVAGAAQFAHKIIANKGMLLTQANQGVRTMEKTA
jgi:hypothetical protein